jgi:hypothetical protein
MSGDPSLKGNFASQTIKGEMTFALRVSFPLNGQLNYAFGLENWDSFQRRFSLDYP